jgi:hypothetical protein
VKISEGARACEPVLVGLVAKAQVVHVLEEQLPPSVFGVPLPSVEQRDRETLVVEELLVDANLSVPTLLVGMVGLLRAELLDKDGACPARAQPKRQHLGRVERGEAARHPANGRHLGSGLDDAT